MIYPRRYRDDGFILFDVVLALTLSVLMIGLISYATLTAQSLYDRSMIKSDILAAYRLHATEFEGLLPGMSIVHTYHAGTSTPSISIGAIARWYGNDRIETDIEASSSGRSIQLKAVRKYPFPPPDDGRGHPLCTPEYTGTLSIAPIILPIDASLPLTDLHVRNGIAYITADSNKQSDPDFLLVDIHDAKHPVALSSLHTGPGLRSLALAGNYVYAAAGSTVSQLHVIRLQNTTSPQLVEKYSLPLPEASTSPPTGTAVYYDSQRIYLGTEKWDGQEFAVLDVRTPESPEYVGGFETGTKVTSIVVRSGNAYVTAADQQQLRTLDVRGSQPIFVSAFSPHGWQRQDGVSVDSFENDLSFGRTSGGFDITSDKEFFLWPEGTTTPFSLNIPGGIYGGVTSRSRIFAITHTPDQELSVFDRSLSTTTASYYSLPVLPQSITCDLATIYILAKTAPAIYAITFK